MSFRSFPKRRTGPAQNFGATKVSLDGYSFASKLEASVYQELKTLCLHNGGYECIGVQPSVYLTAARILYKPDFFIQDIRTKKIIYVEAKGHETAVWAIKLRLWKKYGPGDLWIYKGTHKRPILTEIVKSEGAEDYIK